MRHIIAGDLDVTCPLCAAQPGMNCVSTGGARRPFVAVIHRERRRASEAAVAAMLEQARQAVKEAGGGI